MAASDPLFKDIDSLIDELNVKVEKAKSKPVVERKPPLKIKSLMGNQDLVDYSKMMAEKNALPTKKEPDLVALFCR